jgi:hypothetical protein
MGLALHADEVCGNAQKQLVFAARELQGFPADSEDMEPQFGISLDHCRQSRFPTPEV